MPAKLTRLKTQLQILFLSYKETALALEASVIKLFQPKPHGQFPFFLGLALELFLRKKMEENYNGAKIFSFPQTPFLPQFAGLPDRPKLKLKALLSAL